MPTPSLQDLQHLLREIILPFYELKRDLYKPVSGHPQETDAEHSWSLAFMAVSLAPEIDSSLDVGKVASFAVVHDVVEVYAGDTSVWAEQELLDTKSAREADAVHTMRSRVKAFPKLVDLVESYERKDTKEALFVYALDKLIAIMMQYEEDGYYYKKNKLTRSMYKTRFVAHRKKAHSHPIIAKYYDQLTDLIYEHPDYFYIN
jgi:5'-deoxynucleotidase YfbR-like HD superfamily hydrolase